ncbi:MAG: hypothetical protein LBC70_08745 [Chitinispirillales bacterium]|jgi:hypothetical protein|nr:hypothetical protein [Chitinispirillales bacterium]
MNVKIKRIIDSEKVIVKTSVGLLAGIWRSEYDMPPIGHEYSIEIDIKTKWEELAKTRLQNVNSYKVNVTKEKVAFRGMIDGFEEGVIFFRLTQACLIMINTDFPSCLENEWYELTVDISSVEIWPIGG